MLDEKGNERKKTMKRMDNRRPTHFFINSRQCKIGGDAGVQPTAFPSGNTRNSLSLKKGHVLSASQSAISNLLSFAIVGVTICEILNTLITLPPQENWGVPLIHPWKVFGKKQVS